MKKLLGTMLISLCFISCTSIGKREYQVVIFDQNSIIKNTDELQNKQIAIDGYTFIIKAPENNNIDNMPIMTPYGKDGFGYTIIDTKTGLKADLKDEMVKKLMDELNKMIKR